VSYVGGPGGVAARPTAQEQQAASMQHRPPTAEQTAHRESAASNRGQLASVNQGKPQIAATAKPNEFSSHVVPANRAGGPMPPQGKTAAAPPVAGAPVHARDLPKAAAAAPLGESASEEERNQARDNAALQARHDQERESLAQQQEQDHAKMAAQAKNSQAQAKNSQAMADMERQHQQQTQQLQQRHASEMQQHAPPPQQVAHAAPPPAHSAPPPASHPQGH
jgi:hypothetical protein